MAIAAARNAQDLLQDAELLAGAGRTARAYSVAVLAVEECGKAASLTSLAMMPKRVRARAPIGRMLAWHQAKLVGGLLIAVLPPGSWPSNFDVMADAEVEQILSTVAEPADEADRLKRRGFYVDMDRNGQIREPSEVNESEVTNQLGRARQAAASAHTLLEPDAQAWMANPPAEMVEWLEELVSALNAAGCAGPPKAAADVILRAARKFRARKASPGPLLQRKAAEWSEGRAQRPQA